MGIANVVRAAMTTVIANTVLHAVVAGTTVIGRAAQCTDGSLHFG